MTHQQNSSSVKPAARMNQRHEASGRIIRSILIKKDTRQNQSEQNQNLNPEKDRKPPRTPLLKDSNGSPDDKIHGYDPHSFHDDKQRCMTNKDKPDRGVWTPLRRSDGSNVTDESLSSSTFQSAQVPPESAEGIQMLIIHIFCRSLVKDFLYLY